MMNNDITGLLNLAYEIEGLLLLHLNRGEEAAPEIKELLVSKAGLLLEGLKSADEIENESLDLVPESVTAVAKIAADAEQVPAVAETEPDAAENPAEAVGPVADSETEPAKPENPADEAQEIAESAGSEEEEDAGEEQPVTLTLDEKLARERAADISKAFTLNDKFRFCRELFRNSNDEFKETLEVIASMSDMDEAEEYFYNDLCWDPENEEVKEFMAIVAKHF